MGRAARRNPWRDSGRNLPDLAERSEDPGLVPTQFPAIEPLAPADADVGPPVEAAAYPYPQQGMPRVRFVSVPYPARAAGDDYAGANLAGALPAPRALPFSPIPVLDDYPLSRIAATSLPALQSSVTVPGQSVPLVQPRRLDACS